jgi:uncharacterized protein (DUF2132 family)
MTIEDQQLNNPLHGLKLDTLLNELVNHYGFEILAEYTNINCFKNRATIASSLKFLRKTEWAREKMERFYLYTFKNLPKADDTQYEITPRQRIIPAHQQPREPKVLIRGEAPDPTVRSSNKPHSYSKTSSSQSKEHFRDKRTKNNSNKQSNETFDPWGNSPK